MYRVVKPFEVTASRPAPAFGQEPGPDAVQYKLGTDPDGQEMDVQWLLDHGYIEKDR